MTDLNLSRRALIIDLPRGIVASDAAQSVLQPITGFFARPEVALLFAPSAIEYGGANGYGKITVAGLPDSVALSSLPFKANVAGVEQKNTLPQEFAKDIIADPGTFMNEGYYPDDKGQVTLDGINRAIQDLRSGAARNLLNADFHRVLYEGQPLPAQEGEFDLITTAGAILTMKGAGPGDTDVIIKAEPVKGHTYMIIVHNSREDADPANDLSFDIVPTSIHGGSSKGVRYPRGRTISQNNIMQNLEAAHGVNCGNNGCPKVTLLATDPPRGTLSIAQSPAGTQLTNIITNLK